MSDAIHTVETAADLDAVPGRERDVIAALLSEGAPAVVWLQSWLAGEKDLAAASAHPQLVVGTVENYSAKALKVSQPEQGNSDYVPKSASEAFVLAEGVERVETPQAGLDRFER